VEGIFKYAPSCDLLMPNVYPGFTRGGGVNRISRPADAMSAARQATNGRKPVWVTPQGHIQNSAYHRAPTYRELRNQAWQAIAHDAKGLIWYRESFIENLAASKIGVPYLMREIMGVEEAFRSRSEHGLLRVAAPDSSSFSTGVKKAGGNLYIILVSLKDSEIDAEFEVEGLNGRELLVLSENRHVKAVSGRFLDKFEPYETHVYTTDLEIPETITKYEIEDLIMEEVAARRKEGNLAYHTNDVSLEASCTNSIAFLNDGCISGFVWPGLRGAELLSPHWVEIHFNEAEQVGRVAIYSEAWQTDGVASLRDFKVMLRQDNHWITAAEAKNNEMVPAEVKFIPRIVEAVRIEITGINTRRLAVQEIEVYRE
jgi:hypothetical protein